MKLSEEDAVLCDVLTFDVKYLTPQEVEENLSEMCYRNSWTILKTCCPSNIHFAYKLTVKKNKTEVIYLIEYYHSPKGNRLICNVVDNEFLITSAGNKKVKESARQERRDLLRSVYREMMKRYDILYGD